jgi:hypothetical protein
MSSLETLLLSESALKKIVKDAKLEKKAWLEDILQYFFGSCCSIIGNNSDGVVGNYHIDENKNAVTMTRILASASHGQLVVTAILIQRILQAVSSLSDDEDEPPPPPYAAASGKVAQNLEFAISDAIQATNVKMRQNDDEKQQSHSFHSSSSYGSSSIMIGDCFNLALALLQQQQPDNNEFLDRLLQLTSRTYNSYNYPETMATNVLVPAVHAMKKQCETLAKLHRQYRRNFALVQDLFPPGSIAEWMEPTIRGVPEEQQDHDNDNNDHEHPKDASSSSILWTTKRRMYELAWKLVVAVSKNENDNHHYYYDSKTVLGCLTALLLQRSVSTVGGSANKRAKNEHGKPKSSSSFSEQAIVASIMDKLLSVGASERNHLYEKNDDDELQSNMKQLAQTLSARLHVLTNDQQLKTRYNVAPRSSYVSDSSGNLFSDIEDIPRLVWYLPTIVETMYDTYLASSRSTATIETVHYIEPMTILEDYYHYYHDDENDNGVEIRKLAELAAENTENKSCKSITPSVITASMELNEWAVSVHCLEVVKPSKKLLGTLEELTGSSDWHRVVFPVVNKTLLRLLQENLWVEKATRKAPVSLVTTDDTMSGGDPHHQQQQAHATLGTVQVMGDLTADKQLCKSVVAVYYHALEAIFYCENERKNHSADKLVMSESFHRGLLSCCCACVLKALGYTQKLHPSFNLQNLLIHSVLQFTQSSPYEFLKVSETFLRSLTTNTAKGKIGSPLIFRLPKLLEKYMRQTEVHLLDTLVWSCNNQTNAESLADKIAEFHERSERKREGGVTIWPPKVLAPTLPEEILDGNQSDSESNENQVDSMVYPDKKHKDYGDYQFLSYILRRLLKLSYYRIFALCQELNVPTEYPMASQVWITFRYLIRNHIELLYDRHVDHWILCSLYGVSRTVKYKPEIKFAQIIDAYVAVRGDELGEVTCQKIVRHIKIEPGNDADQNKDGIIGNVIMLYNKVFVPNMKNYLLKSASLKTCTADIAKLRAGQPPSGGVKISVVASSDQATVPADSNRTIVSLQKPDSQAIEQVNSIAV